MRQLNRERIRTLIADREQTLGVVLRDVLSERGHDVVLTEDAESTIHFCSRQRFDVVILDYALPDQSGAAICRMIRAQPGGDAAVILALVDKENPSQIVDVLNAGANDYLPRSARMGEVMNRITVAERGVSESLHRRRRDVTAMAQLSRRNELLLMAVGEGIYGIDLMGRTTFVNPAAAEMLGWRAEDLIGKWIHNVIHHTDASGVVTPNTVCEIHTFQGDTTERCMRRTRFFRRDQSHFDAELIRTPIREHGKLIGAVVSFRDVTEKRLLEAQLVQAQRLEAMGQLAAGVAHEINTPMQYVGDNTRFLGRAFDNLTAVIESTQELIGAHASELSSELLEHLEAVSKKHRVDWLLREIPRAIDQSVDGVEHVARIVRAMREFSHPGAGERRAADINAAIDHVITLARNEWKYVATIETILDDALPQVPVFSGEFNQVILNLLVNAAHAISASRQDSDPLGHIVVRTSQLEDSVVIEVEDSGTGIDEAVLPRIFEPFFTTKEVGVGTGQGLSLVYAVITAKHGGEVEVETEVGRGTTFRVILPFDPEFTVERSFG